MMDKPIFKTLTILFFLLLPICFAHSQEASINALMPTPYCGEGWKIEGNIHLYDQENLYKHIDGEAELYIPYGFETVATAIYAKEDDKKYELTVNIFKMGSVLDAFGIYSNYRSPDSEKARLGYDGFIDESQLMFYKGSYFVQVFSSGKGLADSRYLYACGSTIDKNIIGERQPPKELSFIDIPGIIHGSERYYVKGLFGNAFFQKGIVAQTTKKGPGAQVFIVIGDSTQAIMENCERYTKHLETSGIDYLYKKEPDGITLMVKDPLHKVMFVKQKGRYLIGTSKIEDEADAWSLINMIKSRVP